MTGSQSFIVTVLSLIGLQVSGDLDGLTIYTSRRGRIVHYPIAPAEKPPSALQLQQRYRFATAQNQWQQLPTTTKANWEKAAAASSLCCTGQNLYISASLAPNNHALSTIASRAQVQLSIPTYIPW